MKSTSNIGRHGKISIAKEKDIAEDKYPLYLDGSYWGHNYTNKYKGVDKQIWIEDPFLGDSYNLKKNDRITFYLTNSVIGEKLDDLKRAATKWAKDMVFTPNDKEESILYAAAGIHDDQENQRYQEGYTAYGATDIPLWDKYIKANKQGLDAVTEGDAYKGIILAGEHCDDKYVGYMEGALRSGRKASKALLDQLQLSDSDVKEPKPKAKQIRRRIRRRRL